MDSDEHCCRRYDRPAGTHLPWSHGEQHDTGNAHLDQQDHQRNRNLVERCQGTACTDFLPIFTAAKSAVSYIDTSICTNQPYRYRVQAVNTSVPWSTEYSSIVSATTNLPSAPTALTVSRIDETKLNLSWTDNTSDETGFRIERCTGTGCTTFAEIGTVSANVKTYSDTGLSGSLTYRYRVRAYKTPAGGCAWDSGYTAIAVGITTVTAPSGLAATASNSQQINLSWTNNTVSETGYRIERCTGSSCTTFLEIATVTGKATTWSDTTVAHNTTYRYQIRAMNGTVPWNSGYSNIATATTPAQAAPTGLAASAIATRATLTWTDRTSDETGFKIERCQGAGCSAFAEIGQVGANVTTYADSTVCSGTSYTYQVRATRNSTPTYDTPYSTPATGTPTAVAAVLTATRSSEAQINLTWTNPTTDEDGYRLERCSGSGCSNFVQIASFAANAVSYSDSSLLPNYTYTYRVNGFNTTAACGWQTTSGSASATTTTVAPTGLTATASGRSQINLAWTDTSATETGFKIERCTGTGCTNFIEIAVTSGSGTTWSDMNLPSSTTYRYRVRATKITPYAWDSEYTTVVSATTASVPVAPTALSAQATSSSQINLTWSDVASDATGYRIESCSGTNCSSFSEITAVTLSPKSFSHTGLTPDTTYCYRLRSYKTGTGSWTSAYSNTACSSTAIDSPTSLAAAALNSKTVKLMWNDTSADVSGFNIEGQIWNGQWVVITSLGPNVTSYADTSLIESGKTYSYRIRSFKGAQLSTYSNTVTVKTPAYAPGDAPCLVQDPNAPSITSNPVTTATEGSLYTYQVTATAQGNRTVSYSLPGRPSGMSISPAGLISWTPAFNQSGSQYVTVRVADSGNYSAEQNFMITVTNHNGAPAITSTAVTTARELHPYSYQVIASDPEGDPLTFVLTTAPAGMTISSGGLISWNPATLQYGDNPVVVQVSDGTLATTQSFSLNVAYNTAPAITSIAPATGVEGTAWTHQVVASDPDGDTLMYTLNSAPAGMAISTSGLVKWTPTVTQVGSSTITVQVSDGIASTVQTFPVTITGASQIHKCGTVVTERR